METDSVCSDSHPEDESRQEIKSQLMRLKAFDIVSFNSMAETLFVALITDYINDEGPQPTVVVCAEAAFELDISIETAKRYLLKHSARRAEFEIKEKQVHLRGAK